MAQFDVFRAGKGALVVQYQSDMLDHLRTRVIIPLMTVDQGPPAARRLNPGFDIGGLHYHLYPQLIATFYANELRDKVATLAGERDAIVMAVDILLAGV